MINRKLIFLATLLVMLLAVSAVSAADNNASDVEAMDSQVLGLADDMFDVSVQLDQNDDSPEDVISDEESLKSDSNDLLTSGDVTAGDVTIDDILESSNNLKAYYQQKGVLPATVTVGSDVFTIHEFYYLMSKATSQLSESNTAPITPILGVEAPSSKCTDTAYSAAVTVDKYVAIANQDIDYIAKNKQVRDHVDVIAGKIAYEDYVTMLARVLAYRYNYGDLPNFVSFFSDDPSKVHYIEEGELNPFGLTGKKVWIDADGGSDEIKWEIANALKALGWDVYVGDTYANAHYEDYLNAHPGYVLINIYNGFCAGTMRELVSEPIQKLLKTKHVVCIPVWDTSDWTNPEGMAPYRYGDFRGYSAKRAWDDDFSDLDPSIEDVDQFFKFYGVDYCASPTCQMIIDQFVNGGYYSYIGYKKSTVLSAPDVSTTGSSVSLVATLKDQNNNYLAGEEVVLVFNNVRYVSKTGADGIASFIIPVSSVPETYVANFYYTGSINYRVSSTTAKVEANKVQVNLISSDISMKYGDAGELVAVLTDSRTGNAISGADIVFNINGVEFTVKTDSEGQAKLSCENLLPGVYTVGISYAGSNIYDSASTTAKLTIIGNSTDNGTVDPVVAKAATGPVTGNPIFMMLLAVFAIFGLGLRKQN